MGLLDALDSKLVARWLRALLPGLVYILVAGGVALVSASGALDREQLTDKIDQVGQSLDEHPASVILAIAVAVVIATVIALLAHGLAGVVRRVLLAGRPRRWVDLRRRAAARRPNRPKHDRYLPARLTPIGDRFHHVAERVDAQYGIDAGLAWPRLWLLLPEHALQRIQTAYRQYQSATNVCAWGLLYLALALWWWPAAVVGVLTVVVGYRLARGAAAALADLIEAAIDIELPALARAVGIALPYQRVTPDKGIEINNILNKGA